MSRPLRSEAGCVEHSSSNSAYEGGPLEGLQLQTMLPRELLIPACCVTDERDWDVICLLA